QLVCGALYWPLLFASLSRETARFIWRDRFLAFFASAWLLYLAYSIVWHIDLGPSNDWDLFTPLFVPMAWVIGILLHRRGFSRSVHLLLIGAVLLSVLVVLPEIAKKAKIGERATGILEIVGWESTPVEIYLDGRPHTRTVDRVIMGEHELRVLAKEMKTTHRQVIHVVPGTTTRVVLPPFSE
ncbi:MAG: hypothetical protein ABIH23_15665, partial [bacterium]